MSFLKKSLELVDLTPPVIHEVLASINTPRSLAVWLMFNEGDHRDILQLEINPSDYSDSDSFSKDYLATRFLSKYPFLETGIDTEKVAIRSFIDAELKCYQTNTEWLDPNRALFPEIVEARKIIQHILCKFEASQFPGNPSPSASEILSSAFDSGSWGPGVTSSVRGRRLSSYHKLAGNKQATPGLIRAGLPLWVDTVPCWETSGIPSALAGVTPIHGNRISFVPKNAKTDRIIAIEPHMNIFVQKGLGSFIRQSLKYSGLNLNTQQRNQRLARKGSIDGSLATIDLKAASDTISYRVVRSLLPFNWFEALNTARSQKYECSFYNRPRDYQKFSSMGNAATFELESLIFWALNLATHRLSGVDFRQANLAVFGDDIIAYTSVSKRLTEVLNYCGFEINQGKTFTSGPFRESCGEEFFLGTRVSPFYIRERLNTVPACYKLANRVQTFSSDRGCGLVRDKRYFPVWKLLYLSVPKNLRYRIPHGFSDGGFQCDLDESVQMVKTRKISRYYPVLIYRFRELTFSPKTGHKRDPKYSVPSALLDMVEREENIFSIHPPQPLDRTMFGYRGSGVHKHKWSSTEYWPSLGEWLSISS